MSRSMSDPRIVEILAAFERYVTHSTRCALDGFMCDVIDTQDTRFDSWNNVAIRAVLVAFLVNAPASDLDDMVKRARKSLEWLAEFALQTEYEHAGLGHCFGDKFEIWKQKRLSADAKALRALSRKAKKARAA